MDVSPGGLWKLGVSYAIVEAIDNDKHQLMDTWSAFTVVSVLITLLTPIRGPQHADD